MSPWTETAPKAVSSLDIPPSNSTVKVSIIDTTVRMDKVPLDLFFPQPVGAYKYIAGPSYSFLVENESKGQKILFDLGARKDWENAAKPNVDLVLSYDISLTISQNVSDILAAHSVPLDSINAIVWSHWHFDHQGDPSTFPPSTSLIVGPGFKKRFVPGYPTNPEAPVSDSAYAGRELVEVEPKAGLTVGRFPALDYFGDGSFYLLFSPGHTEDHLCGLARTTADPPSYMFLGGDCVHHAGEHRPTEYIPLPREIKPSPLEAMPQALRSVCPGELFYRLHPVPSVTQPFLKSSSGEDLEESHRTVEKLIELDASDDVFCVMAHDASLLDVVELYPKDANEWKRKGWREKGFWRFLRDFLEVVGQGDGTA